MSGPEIVTDELTREEKEKESSSEEVHEKSVSTDTAALLVLFGVESVQQSTGDQVLWPYHTGRPDEESSAEPGQAESSQLRSQHEGNVKTVAVSDAIVDFKNYDGVQSVRRGDGDIGHNVHQDVFLDVPGARVERNLESTKPSR